MILSHVHIYIFFTARYENFCIILYINSSFIPLARAECDDSLLFSGASSIPLCYVLFPATLFYQLFFHPLSPHLAIYFLVYLSISLFPDSYITPFWGFYFLPFSVHAQTNLRVFNLIVSIIVGLLTLSFFTELSNMQKNMNWDGKHISESQRTTNCVYLWRYSDSTQWKNSQKNDRHPACCVSSHYEGHAPSHSTVGWALLLVHSLLSRSSHNVHPQVAKSNDWERY